MRSFLPRAAPPPDDPRQRRFRILFDAESRAVLGYALRRTERAEDAADVVADTFLVAWRRIDELPSGDEARLWLYGVARRVLANQRRGASRRQQLGERLRDDLRRVLPTVTGPADPTADGDPATAAVRDALRRLPEADRELLLLTSWEGLEPTAIARVTGTPAATVRTRLHRARRRLRAELEADGRATSASPVAPDRRASEERERSSRAGHVPGDTPPLIPTPKQAR